MTSMAHSSPWWRLGGWALAVCIGGVVGGAGCRGCGEDDAAVVATLLKVDGGKVERDRASSVGDWKLAEVGATFGPGDGLATQEHSTAVLGFRNGAELHVEAASIVRFSAGREGALEMDLVMGAGELVAGSDLFEFWSEMGHAVLKEGSRVRLLRQGKGLLFSLEMGSGKLSSVDGPELTMGSGRTYLLSAGSARLQELDPADAGPSDAAQKVDSKVRTTAAGGEVADAGVDSAVDAGSEAPEQEDADSLGKPSLAQGEVTLSVGESATIHTPQAPVFLTLNTKPTCSETAVVELLKSGVRYHGTASVSVELRAGRNRYRVRCVVEGKVQKVPRARGSVRVVRDLGARRLPRRAPTSRVVTNGIRYSITYQNQLPRVVVSWPNPPSAQAYQLHIDGRERPVDGPEVVLPSGTLDEGKHRLFFQAERWRSRTTVVEVAFDNASAAASLSSPPDRSHAVGESVRVSGVAQEGWAVTLEGGTVDVDARNRFLGQVQTDPKRPTVVVRLQHKKHGVHYYLRRPSSAGVVGE